MPKSDSASKEVLFKAVGILAGVALILSYRLFDHGHATPAKATAAAVPKSKPALPPGVATIMDAYAKAESGIEIESSGTVKELLPMEAGAKHQRFTIELANGHTLLLVHDTDTAPPVPAKVGDTLHFRGQYEWNDRGGLIHWTHHDPDMKHEDGWVKLDGKAYR